MTTTAAPDLAPPVASRRGGVLAWGVVFIVLGALAALALAGFIVSWLGMLEESLVRPATPRARRNAPRPPALSLTGAAIMLLTVLWAIGTVWTGIGCCLGRRWVRPVVVAGAGVIVAGGLINFLGLWLNLPALLDSLRDAGGRSVVAPSPNAVMMAFGIRAGLLLLTSVVLPYFAWRYFLDARTAALFDEIDPRPTWLDGRPIPVLAWVALGALVSLYCVLRLDRPTLPAFIVVLNGAPAVVGLAALAVLTAWSSWLCWRLDRLGWILSFVLIIGLRLSFAVFIWSGGSESELAPTADAAAGMTQLRGAKTVGAAAAAAAPWALNVMHAAETLVVASFGLYVARSFPRRYHVGVVTGGT